MKLTKSKQQTSPNNIHFLHVFTILGICWDYCSALGVFQCMLHFACALFNTSKLPCIWRHKAVQWSRCNFVNTTKWSGMEITAGVHGEQCFHCYNGMQLYCVCIIIMEESFQVKKEIVNYFNIILDKYIIAYISSSVSSERAPISVSTNSVY